MRFLSSPLILASLAVVARAVGPGTVSGNTAVHDPSMCKDSSGKWFVFSTAVGIEIRTSTDRTAWTLVGKVWPNGASWTDQYTLTSNGNLWAPDCTYINGQFLLYYSASSFGSQNSAIFLAKSSTGLPGSWTNEGLVTSSSGSNNYNANTLVSWEYVVPFTRELLDWNQVIPCQPIYWKTLEHHPECTGTTYCRRWRD
ncbi:hypothetical protein DXG01_007121 [Tephrocybe rancida]|nr:hypothetical protein DXG01_007121 [Tephrocybe rancida]